MSRPPTGPDDLPPPGTDEPPPTGFYLHPAAALHDTGWRHVEHQGRLRALASAVAGHLPLLHGRVVQREAADARPDDLARAHEPDYLARIRDAADRAEAEGRVQEWGGEVRISGATWRAILGSSGAAVAAALAVARGDLRNAFVATRPPGHRAGPGDAGGHSLVNHLAVAARRLQAEGLARRLLIVDWDVHAATGTEAIFRDDPDVWILSQDEGEEEHPAPRGNVVRRVVSPGSDRQRYLGRFEAGLEEALDLSRPHFVLFSAGFDVLAGDPVGRQRLEPGDVHRITRRLVEAAEDWCHGRLVGVLEGGYDVKRSGEAAAQLLRALAGVPPADAGAARPPDTGPAGPQ